MTGDIMNQTSEVLTDSHIGSKLTALSFQPCKTDTRGSAKELAELLAGPHADSMIQVLPVWEFLSLVRDYEP